MTQKTRKCIASGEIKQENELLRFVKTSDSRLLPDFEKRLSGRGLYVSNSQTLLHKALEKNLFIKSIHLFLKISEDFEEKVRRLLWQKGLDQLRLASKVGALITDFEKAKAQALQQKTAFVVQATDAVLDSDAKTWIDADIECLKVYSIQDLAEALGVENTAFIAVLKNDVTQRVYQNIKRYQTFIEN